MNSKSKRFLELINKFLNGKASSQETSNLFSFFLSHQKTTKWPESFEPKKVVESKIYDKIQSSIKIGSHKNIQKVIPLYKRSIFKYAIAYAIAVSIALLISLTFIFNKDDAQVIEPIIVNNNIKIGTDKAILTLGDGTTVALEKGGNYISNNLSSNGEEIVYTKAAAKPEIAYNYLTIPRGGQYQIKLSDGTQVWLNSESKLKYPVNFIDGETREVQLVYGEAYFDVSPSTEHNGDAFKVLHNMQEVQVLGTEFNIKAYQGENNIYTTLVEGEVAVTYNVSREKLIPEQQSNLNLTDNNMSISTVDIYNETSWKDGVFSFDNKPLKDIMKVLSRWYDTNIVFIDSEIENRRFTGVLDKEQSMEDILSIIHKLNHINYEINNKTVFFK